MSGEKKDLSDKIQQKIATKKEEVVEDEKSFDKFMLNFSCNVFSK